MSVDEIRRKAREAQAIPRDERRFTPDGRVHLDPDDVEALCDLADAADEYRQVALDGERSSAGDHCTRCGCEWPCPTERIRAALARLDGTEDS